MISPSSWVPSTNLELEPNALLAATDQIGHQLVIAGPGSGKTELLAQRADFLLRTGTCPYPRRILAITAKVDAAKTLKDRARERCGTELAARLDCRTFHSFCKFLIDMYRPLLTGSDALKPNYKVGKKSVPGKIISFDSMVPLALKILSSSSLPRTCLIQTFSHVFIDEFQDCTVEQFNFLEKAFLGAEGVKLIAVGDSKQSIMGWAGAMDEIFRSFTTTFSIAAPLQLYQNHRSDPTLRRMQNRMVKIMEPTAAVAEEAIDGSDGVISVRHFADALDEAKAVATEIRSWIEVEGVTPAEVAILLPRQIEYYTPFLQSELRARGVSFRNESLLQDLSTEPIAILLTDLLNVVSSEHSPDSYLRLLEQLDCVDDFTERGMMASRNLLDGIDRVRQHYRNSTKNDIALVRPIVSGFLGRIDPALLSSLSHEYAHGDRMNSLINETLQRIEELIEQTGKLDSALSVFNTSNSVRLMTIHKAKGMEFDRVVVLGVENETFWDKLESERQLFFVGISRPRHRLLMTCASQRERPETSWKWEVDRTPQQEFLNYAVDLA